MSPFTLGMPSILCTDDVHVEQRPCPEEGWINGLNAQWARLNSRGVGWVKWCQMDILSKILMFWYGLNSQNISKSQESVPGSKFRPIAMSNPLSSDIPFKHQPIRFDFAQLERCSNAEAPSHATRCPKSPLVLDQSLVNFSSPASGCPGWGKCSTNCGCNVPIISYNIYNVLQPIQYTTD